MTKVEELAAKYAAFERSDGEGGIDITSYVAFIDGYKQAEKDLELSWKDIEKVCLIAREVHQFRGFWSESVYQEVLKRFNYDKRRTRHCYET